MVFSLISPDNLKNNCVTRMDQFEIIWILVIVIGALNYGLNAYKRDLEDY